MKHYTSVLFVSTSIIGLTASASHAFSITPSQPGATQFYREEVTFPLRNQQQGTTVIDPRLWLEPLPVGGTVVFNTALNAWRLSSDLGFSGWDFQAAPQSLQGSFEIVTYQACGLQNGCGGASTPIRNIAPNLRGVGSLFYIKYHPSATDPQPGQGKLHWIQVVQANYKTRIPGFPVVDNEGKKNNPFYDYPNSRYAGEDFFMDRAYAGGRNNASRATYFDARLYLVEETTPLESKKRTVTIHNGIRWGWTNSVTRRPDDPLICPPNATTNQFITASYGGDPDEDQPGATQEDPLLPSNIENGWQVFEEVPTCRWFDPPSPYGFEFQATGDTLFTEIADFPIGDDDSFTVSVGDIVLGNFSPGDSVDFVSFFGEGISNFTITGIDSPFGDTPETAFPIRLGFDNDTGSFKMRPFAAPVSTPEPGSVLSFLVLGLWGFSGIGKRQ